MSEINQKVDVFGLFAQTAQTYEEAVEKAKKEQGAPQVDRYRIAEDGDYSIRVLPLAPYLNEDGTAKEMDRKGYEYPLHQLFIKIQKPAPKGKKPGEITVPIIRTTDKEVGYSVDLIDKYVEIAKQYDDKDVNEQLEKGSFYGGLKWQYLRAMYVLDMKKDRKGPMLYQASYAQYKSLDEAKLSVWGKLKTKKGHENQECPISGFAGAYPVDIKRTKDGNKTKYTFTVDTLADPDDLTADELQKLLDLPRIPELIYRYTKYQFEATCVFLKQMDDKLQLDVCEQPDFIEAVEKLKGELPADDTSHFDLAKAGESSDGGSDGEVTIDSLWADYDAIAAQDLDSSSREYKDLRDKIQQFIVANELDIRITHSKNNEQLLNEVEEALEENKGQGQAETKADKDPEPEPAPEPEPEKQQDPEPEPAPSRRRRSMPAAEPENKPESETEKDPEPEPEPEPAPEPAPEQPARRRRRI